jgi:hypothetical protein
MAEQDTTLLLLPHDVLVNLFWWLEVNHLRRVSATCRLLQYGQSSPQTPNPVETALRLQAGRSFWTPVNAREAVRELLRHVLSRKARQDLQLVSIAAAIGQSLLSIFVDSEARLRSCGVKGPFPKSDDPNS